MSSSSNWHLSTEQRIGWAVICSHCCKSCNLFSRGTIGSWGLCMAWAGRRNWWLIADSRHSIYSRGLCSGIIGSYWWSRCFYSRFLRPGCSYYRIADSWCWLYRIIGNLGLGTQCLNSNIFWENSNSKDNHCIRLKSIYYLLIGIWGTF